MHAFKRIGGVLVLLLVLAWPSSAWALAEWQMWGVSLEVRVFNAQGFYVESGYGVTATGTSGGGPVLTITCPTSGVVVTYAYTMVSSTWGYWRVGVTKPGATAIVNRRVDWQPDSGPMFDLALSDGTRVLCGPPGSYAAGERMFTNQFLISCVNIVAGVLLWQIASASFRRTTWEF